MCSWCTAPRGDKLQASGTDPSFYLKRQAAFVFVGIVVMVLMSAIDYRKLRDYAVVLYGASIFILLAVFSPVGKKSKGAQAWFQIGSYQLEPSEFAKIGLIVALAALCAHYRGRLGLRQLVRDPGAVGRSLRPHLQAA